MVIHERTVDDKIYNITKRVKDIDLSTEIGCGTFGKIFKTSYANRAYAIKKFTYSNKNELHITTLREIKALRAIKSKYVLKILDIIIYEYTIHLKFFYYEYDLYRLIGEKRLSLEEIKHIFWQILMGTEAIHNAGYIHRDLKTANILIDHVPINNINSINIDRRSDDGKKYKSKEDYHGEESQYSVCICDFGMARVCGKEMSPGVVTLWYRAPEILLGSTTYTKSSDIWSLGCILLEMIHQKPIFKANVDIDELYMIIDLCGSINEQSYPGSTSLPLYNKYNLKEGNRCIFDRFSYFDKNAVDLADKLLRLDPKDRISIENALLHPFFTS